MMGIERYGLRHSFRALWIELEYLFRSEGISEEISMIKKIGEDTKVVSDIMVRDDLLKEDKVSIHVLMLEISMVID